MALRHVMRVCCEGTSEWKWIEMLAQSGGVSELEIVIVTNPVRQLEGVVHRFGKTS